MRFVTAHVTQFLPVIASEATARWALLKMEETECVFRVGEGNAFAYPRAITETARFSVGQAF